MYLFNSIIIDTYYTLRYLQKQLRSLDLWKGSAGEVSLKLKAAIRLCESWCDVPQKLTSTFWPGSEHRWEGPAHEDVFLRAFKRRLEHILHLRTLSDELSLLLTKDELAAFRLGSLFDPLEEAKPLYYNPYTEPQWEEAVKKYEKAIGTIGR